MLCPDVIYRRQRSTRLRSGLSDTFRKHACHPGQEAAPTGWRVWLLLKIQQRIQANATIQENSYAEHPTRQESWLAAHRWCRAEEIHDRRRQREPSLRSALLFDRNQPGRRGSGVENRWSRKQPGSARPWLDRTAVESPQPRRLYPAR